MPGREAERVFLLFQADEFGLLALGVFFAAFASVGLFEIEVRLCVSGLQLDGFLEVRNGFGRLTMLRSARPISASQSQRYPQALVSKPLRRI